MRRGETVILAAGDFPKRGSEARRILESAKRVVCCDSAADIYRQRLHREPVAVVGDGDSLRGDFVSVVRIGEQETNDLEKAIRFCRARHWQRPIILGATGKREDHTIGNIFRALEAGLEIVSDFGRFVPIRDKIALQVKKGAAISIFVADATARMTSRGLEWPLKGVKFSSPYVGTLNRATSARVSITSTKPAMVYVAFA